MSRPWAPATPAGTGRQYPPVWAKWSGKSHVAAAIGHALIDTAGGLLFSRTTDLVQKLQAARRDLALPATLAKLDRYDCLILDDLGYARKDEAETTVLFELIAERYERRSLIATCNQPFSTWDHIFPDPAMTVAAIDRLVHHATILELNTESYRRRTAVAAARGQTERAPPDRRRSSLIVADPDHGDDRAMFDPDTAIIQTKVTSRTSRPRSGASCSCRRR